MPDVMRVVEVSPINGAVTNVLDLQNYTGLVGYARERDTFEYTPPQLAAQTTQLGGTWGGQRAVSARAENGRIAATFLVRGTDVDDCLVRTAQIVRTVDEALLYPNRCLEWRSELADEESYYEIRGPGSWTPVYSSTQMTQESMLLVRLDWPCAPYVRGALQTYLGGDQNVPVKVDLLDIPGDLPPLVDVLVDVDALGPAWTWAGIGWNSLIAAGTPFGPLNVSAADGWTLTSPNSVESGVPFLGYQSGLSSGFIGSAALGAFWGVTDGPSVPGAQYAKRSFSNYRLDPDSPGNPTTLVEVWALTAVAATAIRPRIAAALQQSPGAGFAGTLEYGTRGKELIVPATDADFIYRISLVKLGTLPFPNNPGAVPCELRLYFEWSGAQASTQMYVDYLFFLPSRRSAMGRTGAVDDSFYPRFMPGVSFRKLVHSQLTALLAAHDTSNYGVHHGLGGHAIEPDAFRSGGDVSLCVLGTNHVPDDPDPTTSHNIDTWARLSADLNFQVWPRYRYAVHG